MNDRRRSVHSATFSLQQLLAGAGSRLENRWDDPAAWRVLCEEIAAAWRDDPGVAWVLVLARNGLGPVPPPGDQQCGSAVAWTAASDRTGWRDLDAEPAFWTNLEATPGGLLAGVGLPPLGSGCLSPDGTFAPGPWLAAGVPGGRGPAMAILLGLSRALGAPPESDSLAAPLLSACSFLAPVLGMHRRLADLAAAATATRSECEALSRLGELRARLAAVTAHELKTPLTSITAYAEVLEQQVGEPGFSHAGEFLRVIRGEADRLLRLVDRLLDSSRRGRGPALVNPQPVSAGALVAEAKRIMAPQAAARDLTLEAHLPADLPRLDGDADLIRQVVLNLLGNALKFTPSGGRVTVSVREDASTVRLAVADNGPGIAPQELRAIFQSFYRTRAASQTEGVGLGLSIVKEIVSLHGGHLDVHSRCGRGTTFGIHLPKEQHHAAADSALATWCGDPLVPQRLAAHTLRLVAELAAARGVAVILPGADSETLLVTAALGLGPNAAGSVMPAAGDLVQLGRREARLVAGTALLPAAFAGVGDHAGAAMVAPLRLGSQVESGVILAARRLGGGIFGTDDLVLLRVLAEILSKAWMAALQGGNDRREQEMVTEALTALTGLRRSGVPTADPLALRMLSRTGRRLGQSSFEIRLLQYAGALHDAGMVLLDPDVVLKPEQLDLDERDHIDAHPQRGIDLLGPLVELPDLQAIIRHHHERFDGRGYPEGRAGEEIPLGARILAVVDAFFAMVRSRPWREGLPVAAAVAELQRHAGTQFDERVVTCFLGTLLEEGLLSASGRERTVGSGTRR